MRCRAAHRIGERVANDRVLDNIDELRTFQRIAAEGSLSAAARSLGLTVNAVSRRLVRLEHRVGVPLAERTTRSFRLTDDGRRLLVRIHRIVTEVDDAEEALTPRGVRGRSGLVRAMVHPATLQTGFMEKLSSLLTEHPRLRVHVLTRNAPGDPVQEGADLAVACHASAPRTQLGFGGQEGALVGGCPRWSSRL